MLSSGHLKAGEGPKGRPGEEAEAGRRPEPICPPGRGRRCRPEARGGAASSAGKLQPRTRPPALGGQPPPPPRRAWRTRSAVRDGRRFTACLISGQKLEDEQPGQRRPGALGAAEAQRRAPGRGPANERACRCPGPTLAGLFLPTCVLCRAAAWRASQVRPRMSFLSCSRSGMDRPGRPAWKGARRRGPFALCASGCLLFPPNS